MLTAFAGSSCGPLVGARQSGFEHEYPTRAASARFTTSEKSSLIFRYDTLPGFHFKFGHGPGGKVYAQSMFFVDLFRPRWIRRVIERNVEFKAAEEFGKSCKFKESVDYAWVERHAAEEFRFFEERVDAIEAKAD